MERKTDDKKKIHMIPIHGRNRNQLPEVYDARCKILPDDPGRKKEYPVPASAQISSPVRVKAPGTKRLSVSGKLKPLRRKLRRGGTAALVGLSVGLAGLFNSPSDIMQQQVLNNLNPDYAVEFMIDEENLPSEEEERKAGDGSGKGFWQRAKNSVRNLIRGIPQGIKACVFVPLWAAGYALTGLVSFLFHSAVSPVLGHILGLAGFALVLLAVYAVTMKILFPKMPLRKILSFRNILKVLAGAVILKAADIILPLFWQDYFRVRNIILFCVGTVVIMILVFGFLRHSRKKKTA